jgi:hypothetical protein
VFDFLLDTPPPLGEEFMGRLFDDLMDRVWLAHESRKTRRLQVRDPVPAVDDRRRYTRPDDLVRHTEAMMDSCLLVV